MGMQEERKKIKARIEKLQLENKNLIGNRTFEELSEDEQNVCLRRQKRIANLYLEDARILAK